jgi:NDP-sugar pyrophosphorylase family protein
MALLPAGMILAAGLGTRLKPLTELRPKPLMEIGGQAIIFYLINKLIKSGIKDIFINVHYQADQIINAVKNMNFDAQINFSVEKEILGSAGGVNQVVRKFGLIGRELLVINGDIWCDFDLKSLLTSSHFVTLLCAQDLVVEGYMGSVACDEKQQITELGRYYKKNELPALRGFFSGVHFLSAQALKELHDMKDTCLVSQIYPAWLGQSKEIKAHMAQFSYEDLGSLSRLWRKNLSLGTYIHPQAKVERGVKIDSDVIIGADAHIKKGARLKNSVIMSGTVIEKNENLDCVIALLGLRVNLKSGGVTC